MWTKERTNLPIYFLFQPFVSACYNKLCNFLYLLLCLFCLNLMAFREGSCLAILPKLTDLLSEIQLYICMYSVTIMETLTNEQNYKCF